MRDLPIGITACSLPLHQCFCHHKQYYKRAKTAAAKSPERNAVSTGITNSAGKKDLHGESHSALKIPTASKKVIRLIAGGFTKTQQVQTNFTKFALSPLVFLTLVATGGDLLGGDRESC